MFSVQTRTKGKVEITLFFPDVLETAEWHTLEKSMPEEFRLDIAQRIDGGFPVRKGKLNVTIVGKSWDETFAMLFDVKPGVGDGDKLIEDTRKEVAKKPLKISVYLFDTSPFGLGRDPFRFNRFDPFGFGGDPFFPFGLGGSGPFGFGTGFTEYMSELIKDSEEMLELLKALESGDEFPLEAYVKKYGKDAKCFCGTPNCAFQDAIDNEKRRQGLIK